MYIDIEEKTRISSHSVPILVSNDGPKSGFV